METNDYGKEFIFMGVNVYFVRHGQTYLNEFNKMQGWSDAPLTDKGLADADNAGDVLKAVSFDYAFSSDLKRAIDTAKHILARNTSDHTEPITDPAFREVFFGYFEGDHSSLTATTVAGMTSVKSWEDLIAMVGIEKSRDLTKAADPFSRAENDEEFWHRLTPGLDRLRNLPDGSNVLVVAHGMTIRSLISRFTDTKAYLDAPKNGSITKLTLSPSTTTVDYYNHLTLGGNQ